MSKIKKENMTNFLIRKERKMKKTDLLKNMSKVVVFSLVIAILFGSYAFAFGVTKKSMTCPTSAKVGDNKTYQLTLTYDTEIYGIPTPEKGRIGAEIPSNYKKPVYKSGSFETMTFIDKTGLSTGTSVWQCYKTFWILGVEDKSYKLSAKADKTGNKRGYLGVGDSFGWTGYDHYFSTKIN